VDERMFGLRTEYSVVFSPAGQREPSPEELGRRLFGPVVSRGLGRSVLLRNGGRLHLEVVGRPEYATPECGNPVELIVHDKAGERILEGLLADAGQRLRDEGSAGDIRIFKRGAGPAGGSSGCQEDYLVGRGGRFGRLADFLIPFLVTRQLICGGGAVVPAPGGAVYCLSRRGGHAGNGLSAAATRSRPLINTFDEPPQPRGGCA
jgi:proteasome accessory factor A